MLTVTVLIYSVCTGFSFFSQTYWDFAVARFLTGLGVGGVFGLAVALIAETLPELLVQAPWVGCRSSRRSAIFPPACVLMVLSTLWPATT